MRLENSYVHFYVVVVIYYIISNEFVCLFVCVLATAPTAAYETHMQWYTQLHGCISVRVGRYALISLKAPFYTEQLYCNTGPRAYVHV